MKILTVKLIRDAVDYLRSDEYAQKSIEKQRVQLGAETIIIKALQQNKMSEVDYCKYMLNIQINRMLLLHPKDSNYKVLNKIAKQLEKCHTQTKK